MKQSSVFDKLFNIFFTTAVVVIFVIIIGFTAYILCNDTYHEYNYAYITLQNGETIEGKCTYSYVHDSGKMIDIIIDGIKYSTSTENVTLIKKEELK